MTSKERLLALINGRDYDRTPFNFYELNGFDQDPSNKNPFNIFTDPSWHPLLNLTREKSDVILLRDPAPVYSEPVTNKKPIYTENIEQFYDENGSLFTNYTLEIDGRKLTQRTRRDRDIDTIWTLEHLLKDSDDLEAWLKLPLKTAVDYTYTSIFEAEEMIGDHGIVCVDSADSLATIAGLFSMEEYLVTAMTEPELFMAALDKVQTGILDKIKIIAQKVPNHMWRIYGPEYAGIPYLPPKLYDEYVGNYDDKIMSVIRNSGGFPRVHQHGNIKDNLDTLVRMGVWGLDPIEPPGQGNVTLKYMRENYGDKLVLFGNLEATDIENISPDEFEEKIVTALDEGESGSGVGFVLQPGAAPYGRHLTDTALNNYKRWVEIMERRYPGTL